MAGPCSAAREFLLDAVNRIVFAILDQLDRCLCPIFSLLDSWLDDEPAPCYCDISRRQQHHHQTPLLGGESNGDSEGPSERRWGRSSDTIYAAVRRLRATDDGRTRPLRSGSTDEFSSKSAGADVDRSARKERTGEQCGDRSSGQSSSSRRAARWSDCACARCFVEEQEQQADEERLLHVYVHKPEKVVAPSVVGAEGKNVIFIHGFLSSSSFWVDTLFPALDALGFCSSHRLFAVDVLGFGKSPKPSNSLYTIADHLDAIRRSVFEAHGITSFHLVAHSMGCTIALAVAAQYASAVRSVVLIAPPYYHASHGSSSDTYLMQQLAPRKLLPLRTFGGSVMSWYEHIGRVVCFVVCKHHRLWEPLALSLLGDRLPSSMVTDFTRHTHHSAWHVFHNTICNGADSVHNCLKVLLEAGRGVRVVHGTMDTVVPFSGSEKLCQTYPNVRLTAVLDADHRTVILGREEKLALELAEEVFFFDAGQP